MASKSFQLGKTPRLSFQACMGGLRIQGWDLDEVQLPSTRESEAATVQEADGALVITAGVSGTVNVPPGASVLLQGCVGDVHATNFANLRVERHNGDLSVHQVKQVELETVSGDVQVREAQSVQASTLHGDLRMRRIDGTLAVATVHGDVAAEGTTGQLTLQDITGDVRIREPGGHLEVRNVTGDVALSGNLQTGDYHVEALGDVTLNLEATSDTTLDLEARLGRVACGLKLAELDESAHRLTGKMGQGTAQVRVVAQAGDIRLRPLGADQVRHDMEKERIWAEAHARRAAERAERMAEKARRVSERLAQKAEERASRMHRWQVKWGAPQPERAPTENLENERLAILKMLAEGKVNAEQAEGLLKALEG